MLLHVSEEFHEINGLIMPNQYRPNFLTYACVTWPHFWGREVFFFFFFRVPFWAFLRQFFVLLASCIMSI